MTQALAPVTEDRRGAALLKAVGLDRVPPEQRELALAIADRYALDLMLKHVVLIDGRPYITRDGLLHIAHRSGAFDGMEVSDPAILNVPGAGEFWSARASVWRKDMSRPFTYAGRYPTKGGNQRFAPEMAVKVAEVMALRRAFDVSAPVLEERWDMDASPTPEPAAPPATTAQSIAAARERVRTTQAATPAHDPAQRPADTTPPASDPATVEPAAGPPLPAAGEADIVDGQAVEVAAVAGVTGGELREWLREQRITIPVAREVCMRLFRVDSFDRITDEQRGHLVLELDGGARS